MPFAVVLVLVAEIWLRGAQSGENVGPVGRPCEYQNVERTVGTTKWSFWSLFKYALDGITSFSVSPLRIIAVLGFIISALAFVWIIITLIQTLIMGIDVPGYVTTLCAVLFMGGIIEMSVGVLGEYIGRIYIEAKDRPIYIAAETNLEEDHQ